MMARPSLALLRSCTNNNLQMMDHRLSNGRYEPRTRLTNMMVGGGGAASSWFATTTNTASANGGTKHQQPQQRPAQQVVGPEPTTGGAGLGNVHDQMLPSADGSDLFRHTKHPLTVSIIGCVCYVHNNNMLRPDCCEGRSFRRVCLAK
jgi:hypothetical protein